MKGLEHTAIGKNPTLGPLVQRLSEVPGVLAIFLGGSWSTNDGDEHSDVDIGILNNSGRLEKDLLPAVLGFGRLRRSIPDVCPPEVVIWDDDNWPLHVRCASISDWREALHICENNPIDAELNQLEMLQTCHFLVPLFDPDGIAAQFKQESQTKPDSFWSSYGAIHLESCHDLVALWRKKVELPPLAWALTDGCGLDRVFRTLGALNRCFYFSGSREEKYIADFPLQPRETRQRLVWLHRMVDDLGVSVREQTEELESLVSDVDRLFRSTFEPSLAATDLRCSPQWPLPVRSSEESYTVESWIQTREQLIWHSRFVAEFVYDWPGPLSKYVDRGAFCNYQGWLRNMVDTLTNVLLRLNAIESVALDKLDETLNSLPLQPKNTYSRILDILRAKPEDALAPLEALARETEAVVLAN